VAPSLRTTSLTTPSQTFPNHEHCGASCGSTVLYSCYLIEWTEKTLACEPPHVGASPTGKNRNVMPEKPDEDDYE
jgi:hypothetical protein